MIKSKLLFSMLVLFLSLMVSEKTNAQDGCCGLNFFSAGISASVGYYQVNPEGLNHYIDVYNSRRLTTLTKKMDEFGGGLGWKVTLNYLRLVVDNLELNMYVHYANTNEEHSAENNSANAKRTFELQTSQWGFGLNLYMPLSRKLQFKCLDVAVTTNSAKLLNKYVDNTTSTSEELKSSESGYGVMLETGLRYYIMKPYVAVSVNAGYNYFTIDEMEFENGGRILQTSETETRAMDNFITNGGFYANAQLTISIPFEY